jgi:L-ribulose-5-phosphate 3-epimerase
MFKIGTLADWFGKGLMEGIRESQRCGAEGVQLYAAGELDPDKMTPAMLRQVAETARSCGQTVAALCGELGGHGLEKKEDNGGKIRYLKKVINMGQDLGCNVITTHIGVVPADVKDPIYSNMSEALMEIGEYAAARGSYIAVETGPEKIATLKAFVDSCGAGVAINYDPANIVMVTGDNHVQGVFTADKSIVHTHAKDGINLEPVDPLFYYRMFAEGGLEWARSHTYAKEMPLGEGSVRWAEYLSALKSIGYSGFLTIEREVKNGAEDIRMAVKFLQNAISNMA